MTLSACNNSMQKNLGVIVEYEDRVGYVKLYGSTNSKSFLQALFAPNPVPKCLCDQNFR